MSDVERPGALLFDLGGVVIDLDFERAFARWQRASRLSPDALRAALREDAPYERHERGEMDAPAYFAHLAAELGIEAGDEAVEAGWNDIYVGVFDETLAMIAAVRRALPCYALTNTNATHARTWMRRFPQVADAFDRVFASHEIGLRKPDRAAFDHVCEAIGLPASSVVFFDDVAANLHGAAAAGLRTVLVRSPDDVRRALRDLGLVP